MSRCKSCGAEIIWAATSQGKAMPVDAEPNPDGNVLVTKRSGMVPLATVMGRDKAGDMAELLADDLSSAHTSHFATCPHAAAHRRQA